MLVSVVGLGCNNFGRRLDLEATRAVVDAAIDAGGHSLLDVAIGGLAALPGCASVIAGATSPAQVRANAAAGEWIPTAQELAEVSKIAPPPG